MPWLGVVYSAYFIRFLGREFPCASIDHLAETPYQDVIALDQCSRCTESAVEDKAHHYSVFRDVYIIAE